MNNITYIENLYQQWKKNPTSVDASWSSYFSEGARTEEVLPRPKAPAGRDDMAYRQSRVDSLLWAYRDIGYLYARLNPLGGDFGPEHDYLRHEVPDVYEKLTLEQFRIPQEDLDTVFSAGRVMKPSPAPLREIIKAFEETYCGSIGVEFLHIQNKKIRHWLIEKMESTRNRPALDAAQKRIILEDLIRTEALEQMLHRSFVGQKRFSLEGSEVIIPGLHFLVDSASRYDIEEFVIGTTHRGRLAILNTILHMTPEEIFSRFEENFRPELSGGSGDVKYHIGYETDHILDNGEKVHISMAANASHLESVDGIVQGKARALQDKEKDDRRKRILPVLLHGDAAFSGQGVVAENFNLSKLAGYTTGGTIHIIINNQIGFTTSARDFRSSVFPTDAAKALAVPIFHVNGDDPEAVVYAADLALQFRHKFGADCVIDVFCYRRHGHNEADEPSFTHPHMYQIVSNHPGPSAIYGKKLAEDDVVGEQEQASIKEQYMNSLKQALENSKSEPISQIDTTQGPEWAGISSRYSHGKVDTGVAESILRRIAGHILTVPEGFNIHPILGRILKRKRDTFEKKSIVDWSFAEALAFGSLLLERIHVRLSGEDCVRGTFSQRHLRWWDTKSKERRSYTALQAIDEEQAELMAYDSPLSEYSVVGFEYGYSLINPYSLVIWEAQFGDFSNGAQVIIDNYIASAESKWGRSSGLVLLLPHGYEGQGPDHSCAHLERFLQLAACDNIQVCNVTTPAQYFHLLRRQVKAGFRKPLVLMTPKSLLRHPKVVSPIGELAEGAFSEVLEDSCEPDNIEKILLCSGKIYYDLIAQRNETDNDSTALIRIEQFYPFPEQALGSCLEKYSHVPNVTWIQEEPKNYGAWSYINESFRTYLPQINLKYLGRDESSSSATGSFKQHEAEQKKLVEDAFNLVTTRQAEGKQ